MGGYEHFWSSRLSSNVVFSQASAPEEDFYAADFNEELDYAAVNLLYWFLPGPRVGRRRVSARPP